MGDGGTKSLNGATKAAKQQSSELSSEVKLLLSVGGIYFCYLSSGVLQEHIYSYKSEEGERFSQTLLLLWFQCLVNVAFSGVMIKVIGGSGEIIPVRLFAAAGCAYICAMICSIEALKYVNFPTKELGKSCKMVPVMLFGVLFAKKKYSFRDYVCVALITAGIIIFNLSGKHKGGGEGNSAYGLGLLFASLVLDGVTGSTQDNLKRKYKHSVHEMMFYMNLMALLILTPAALVTGQAVSGTVFCLANPAVLMDLVGFALMAAVGQNFIYYSINHFSALVCTTITTTRKFFTILCSVIFFGHPMNVKQWGGVLLVFAGIGGNMMGKYTKSQAAKKEKMEASKVK
jgi:UDP-galactose transporter B1